MTYKIFLFTDSILGSVNELYCLMTKMRIRLITKTSNKRHHNRNYFTYSHHSENLYGTSLQEKPQSSMDFKRGKRVNQSTHYIRNLGRFFSNQIKEKTTTITNIDTDTTNNNEQRERETETENERTITRKRKVCLSI